MSNFAKARYTLPVYTGRIVCTGLKRNFELRQTLQEQKLGAKATAVVYREKWLNLSTTKDFADMLTSESQLVNVNL